MEIKVNRNNAKDVYEAAGGVLRMTGLKHILIVINDGKCMIGSDMPDGDHFETALIYAIFGACGTKRETMETLARMAGRVIQMKEPEETEREE